MIESIHSFFLLIFFNWCLAYGLVKEQDLEIVFSTNLSELECI